MPPAPTPLSRARGRLLRAAEIAPVFLIAASGGKDSNALFPLLAEVRRRRPGVRLGAFHYTICRGLRCVERPIELLCARYDVPLRTYTAPFLPKLVYEGYCRRRTALAERAYHAQLKPNDVEDAARLWLACHLAGRDPVDLLPREGEEEARLALSDLPVDPYKGIWYVGGQRQNDSLERRAMLSSFRKQLRELPGGEKVPTGGELGVNPKERRVYPLADWASKQVHDYNRARDVPPAADLGGADTKGINPGDPAAMAALRRNYPRDFARLCEVFPLAAAAADEG